MTTKIVQITPAPHDVTESTGFLPACDEAAAMFCAYVLDPERDGFNVYRSRLTGTAHPIDGSASTLRTEGRFLGHVATATPEDVLALLSDGRCPFCAWPSSTGFPSEATQRTPVCDHNPVVWLRCACCDAETVGRQWWNRDAGFGVCSSCFLRDRSVDAYGLPGVHHSLYGVPGVRL